MTTNDPGREPEPTDAELLKRLAAEIRASEIGVGSMESENLAIDAVIIRGREYLSGERHMPDTKLCGAVTQAGEDRKFRTCEKPAGHDGMHKTTICGQGWSWMPNTPAAPVIGSNQCEHGHLARVCVTCELIAAEARVAELEAALTAAADGLLRVESVSHLCNNCCAYETAHEVRQEWHGFDQVLAAPGKEPTDA